MRLTNQHGDVLFYLTDEKPDFRGCKRKRAKGGRLIVAEGELTGHAHVIEEVEKCRMYEDPDGTLWLKVDKQVEVVHEEHTAQALQPGVYRVGIVREVDPFSREIRDVQD